jgi:hypothetical protein
MDEWCFTRTGIANIRYEHVWQGENRRTIRSQHKQRQFSTELWIGILDDCLIGPHILPARVGVHDHHDFLRVH